jgi:hypothetical protein
MLINTKEGIVQRYNIEGTDVRSTSRDKNISAEGGGKVSNQISKPHEQRSELTK